MEPKKRARSVRIRQLFLLIGGVAGALALPLSILGELSGFIALASMASTLVMPVAYYLFATSVQEGVAEKVLHGSCDSGVRGSRSGACARARS